MKFKNTKTLFLVAFFGSFLIPASIIFFWGFVGFFDSDGFVSVIYNWAIGAGGIWLLIVLEIIIVLITLMLWYTLKLKDVESLTVEEVVGKRKKKIIKKVNKLEIEDINSKPSKGRKKIKEMEKRHYDPDDDGAVQRRNRNNEPEQKPNPTPSSPPQNNPPSQNSRPTKRRGPII